VACREMDRIEAYADGQLDLGSSLNIEQHLIGCETCAAALEKQQTLRSVMGRASLYYDAPPQLSARIRSAVRRQAKVPAVSRPAAPAAWRWFAVAAPAASIAILVWALVAVSRTPSKGDLLDREIASAHARSLMGDHLMDFPSSNQHTVKPSLSGRLDFSPEVKDLSSAGFDLLGGRLDYLDNRPAAAIVYERRKHLINLFVWPLEAGAVERPVETSLRGYNMIHWAQSGMNYVAVSDLNPAELQSFRRALQD
jgi:anti-sigma factor RsiW